MSGIVWWEFESPHPEALQTFFERLRGWRFEPSFMEAGLGARYWVISSDDQVVGGLQESDAEPSSAGTRIYLGTDDLEAELDRILAAGGGIDRGRTALGGDDRWFAVAREPGGVRFGLWTPLPPVDLQLSVATSAAPSEVWRSLVRERHGWWPELRGEPVAGAALMETWTEGGVERSASGAVVEASEDRAFVFDWTEPGWTAPLRVRIVVEPAVGGSLVHIVETGFGGLANGDVLRAAHLDGWRYHLDRLRAHAEGRPPAGRGERT